MMVDPTIPDNPDECRHASATLCMALTDDGRYTAYQCDECGWVTNQDPTPEDCLRNDLPLIDDAMWQAAIDRWLRRLVKRNEPTLNAARFFVRAAQRG